MKRFGFGMALAAALLFSSSAEAGEMKEGRFTVGLGAGYSVPLADFGDAYTGSFTVGGNLLYWLTESISVGLGITTAFDHRPDLDTSAGSDYSALILGITPSAAYSLALRESLSLRIAIKGGPYYLRETVETTEGTSLEIYDEETYSDFIQVARSEDAWEPGLSGGACLEYAFSGNLSLGLHLDYHIVFTDDDDIQILIPLLSLGYTFD